MGVAAPREPGPSHPVDWSNGSALVAREHSGRHRLVYLLGERGSGTRWLRRLLQVELQVEVKDCLCSFKHFMQIPCDLPPTVGRTMALVLVVTRNPYDWLATLHARPLHAPSHQGLPFAEFLRKPWALDDLGTDHRLVAMDARSDACPVSRHDLAFSSRPNAFALQTNRSYHFDGSCDLAEASLEPWQRRLPEAFCGRSPAYEADEAHGGEPFASVLQLRGAKLRNHHAIGNWAGLPVEHVSYDALIADFPHRLQGWVQQLARRHALLPWRAASSAPEPPPAAEARRSKRRQLLRQSQLTPSDGPAATPAEDSNAEGPTAEVHEAMDATEREYVWDHEAEQLYHRRCLLPSMGGEGEEHEGATSGLSKWSPELLRYANAHIDWEAEALFGFEQLAADLPACTGQQSREDLVRAAAERLRHQPSLPACTKRYVSPSGSDAGNAGCDAKAPLRTLSTCVALSVAGDACLLLPGRHATAVPNGLHISKKRNFTIAAAPESVWSEEARSHPRQPAILDGTVELRGWERRSDEHGSYYRSLKPYSGTERPWQLFIDETPLTSARWPNAEAWSGAWWDRDVSWARQAEQGVSCGHMVDGAHSAATDLAATNLSFNGCNAIINNEHWLMRRYKVRGHDAGSPSFGYAYDPSASTSTCHRFFDDTASNRYFLDGCVAAFDAPGEWVIDAEGHLLLRLPRAMADSHEEGLSDLTVRGKVQTYALAVTACDDLTVRGLHFFGTALLIYDSRRPRVDGNVFTYPSASRRSLGADETEFDAATRYGGIAAGAADLGLRPGSKAIEEHEIAIPPVWIGRNPDAPIATASAVTNNEILYSEGPGLVCAWCSHDLIENNLVSQAGHPSGRSLQLQGTSTSHVTLRRNTIDLSGSGGIAWLWGCCNVAELNHVSHTGMLTVDNEGIKGGQLTTNTTFRFNWVHDTGGQGLRFDTGEEGLFNVSNHLQFNVVFRNPNGGLSGKSDAAFNYRNTGTDNQRGVDPEMAGERMRLASHRPQFMGLHRRISSPRFTEGAADMKICACYPATCQGRREWGTVPAYTNRGSITRGNVGQLSPGTDGGLLNPYDIPAMHDHNLNLYLESFGSTDERERRALYRHYETLDFRPAFGSPLIDAGADSSLPGPRAAEGLAAPVVRAAVTVGTAPDIGAYEYGDSEYWIPGRQIAWASAPVPYDGAAGVLPSADLMFLQGRGARSHRVLLAAEEGGALEHVTTLHGSDNVFVPPSRFRPGATYRWRVDAVGAAGGNGTVEGPVWSFSVGCEDVDCADCGTSPHSGACNECVAGTTLLGGRCVLDGGCADGLWDVDTTAASYSPGRCAVSPGSQVCSFRNISGAVTDRFEVGIAKVPTCAVTGNRQAVLLHNGLEVSGYEDLSCANQNFTVSAAFTCLRCDVGLVHDPSQPSGCRPSDEPSTFIQ